MRAALVLAGLAACRPGATPTSPAPPASDFGFYVLAMAWAPCTGQPGAFAATHLTLHGLWPNFTDEQSRGRPRAWPQYCGRYARCEQREDASCAPDAAVPPELARLAPSYVAGDGSFAIHEWSKHGSCTRLGAAAYFRAQLAAIHAIPAGATPDALRAAIGTDLPRDELQRAFGVPPTAVVLGCDAQCRLTQVGFCVGKDAADLPTAPIACSPNVTTSAYDNGCVTRGCARVAIPATGACTPR